MKTPEEIAAEQMAAFTLIESDRFPMDHDQAPYDVEETAAWYIAEQIIAAIKADRKQRDLYELIAEALDERAQLDTGDDGARHPAAEVLRNTSAEIIVDTTWDDFIGPMLDAMEKEYGR